MDGTLDALQIDFRLMHQYQDWLDKQQQFMVQWNQAQDVIVTVHSVMLLGAFAALYYMAYKIRDMESNSGNPR